jgi:hypothetical protein
LVLPFFIYIPVSIFDSSIFLFIFDLLLILAIVATFLQKNIIRYIFGGQTLLLFLIILYILSVLVGLITELIGLVDSSTISNFAIYKELRNLLFGIGVFAITSIWIHNQLRVDKVIKTLLLGAIFITLYGFRQLLFGYFDFELYRLSKMGASLLEMTIWSRIRLTSTFGDPLTCGVYLMIGTMVFYIAKSRSLLPRITKYKIIPIILFIAVVLTLSRAPLFGMVIGGLLVYFLNFRPDRKMIENFLKNLSFFIIFILLTSFLVNNYFLSADYEKMSFPIIGNALKSFYSIFQMFFADANNDDIAVSFWSNQSQSHRIIAWGKGLNILALNPLGGIYESKYAFYLGDVGYLSYGLKSGFYGMVSIMLIWFIITLRSYLFFRTLPVSKARNEGYLFLGIWISIIISCGISEILQNSVLSIPTWTIAAILVNQKKILLSQIYISNRL